ncbi:DUF262 domain-containing protein [Vibrio splendidus]|uniref:DUF262 domain-containing protein n=1 Tax=Vibrio splendidus TaxID=29497 RepID=UPI000C8230EA|nr:DUF262 domain-containing protein [Vibrio splendidus]PMK06289.1 hypothetical protein BCU08_17225 [Vibrio splendidus]
MDLKGAEIRNFYSITNDMPSHGDAPASPKTVKIPHYQRPYKWGRDQIEKLIEDWHNETGDSYFSGSIVTVNDSRNSIHELIDGQQRFTTIYLANYVRFLLSRVAIRQAITESNRVIHISGLLDSFEKSAKFLFSKQLSDGSTLNEYLHSLRESVTSVFEQDDPDNVDIDAIENNYSKRVGLPSNFVESDVNYEIKHKEGLEDYLSRRSLSLQYDRSSFDVALTSALSRCLIKVSNQSHPTFHIDEKDITENEKKYTDALETIFAKFYSITEDKTPFFKSKLIIDCIKQYLEQVKVCVVQTGNARDAYTLFEVLNDRSLALDDLDLIKNQFYKTYVLSNQGKSESHIDSLLQQLDDQWVDTIFNSSTASLNKLITYFATCYITGSTEVLYNKGDGYRDAISQYLSKLDSYNDEDIQKDFNIFQACKVIISKVGIAFRSTDLKAIEAEFSQRSNVTKTLHYLNAMKQEGVMSGLVNYILKFVDIQEQEASSKPNIFDPSLTNKVITRLVEQNLDSSVQNQAYNLFRTSILSSSAAAPRNMAIDLIKTNNRNTSYLFDVAQKVSDDVLKGEFSSWLDQWSFDNNKLKIRILFARLIRLTPDQTTRKLRESTIGLSVPQDLVAKMQIDHLEARNPNPSNLVSYFDHPERAYYVDGLGNMMPLPSKENIEKSNRPLKESFIYFKDAGLPESHYLLAETKNLFEMESTDGVPNESFFNKRKQLLKGYFLEAISYNPSNAPS